MKMTGKIDTLLMKHPSIVYAEEMKTVVKPLDKLGISYFSHVRIDEQDKVAINASDPYYLAQYYQQGFYNFDLHMSVPQKNQRVFLWDAVQFYGKTEELYQLAWSHDISHIFTLIHNEDNIKNLYHFAAKPGHSSINNFYLQHTDLLESFISYFKEQLFLNDHLNAAYSLSCDISKTTGGYLVKGMENIPQQEQEFAEFLIHIGTHKNHTLTTEQQAHITRRERQCAYYLLEGYTSKEIANRLVLSPRTVEVYLERLRVRFGSKNKIQLARHIIEANLLK